MQSELIYTGRMMILMIVVLRIGGADNRRARMIEKLQPASTNASNFVLW